VRSIRLSLLGYFLGLLALALGEASWLLYHTAHEQLVARKESTQKLIEARFKERYKEEKDRLDEQLLFQAQNLAGVVRLQRDWSRIRDHSSSPARELHLFGIGSCPSLPNGHLLAVLPMATSIRWSPVWFEMSRQWLPDIKVDEEELTHFVKQMPEFFQIDIKGRSYHSAALGDRTLVLDFRNFAPDQVLFSKYDDYALGDGRTLRRVILKTSSFRPVPVGAPRPRGRGESRKPPDPPHFEALNGLPLFIQCAYDVSRRDAIRQQLEQSRDEELADLDRKTEQSLAGLRTRLWLIGSLTFAATVVGTFFLVRRGLSPLRRLSDAVSRVSPRDFRLPIDEGKLPVELRPIAGRLTETLDLLKRAFAREKQATADISHDLRTPLAALLTTIELALRKPRSAEDYRELLRDCQLSGKQMNQAVERLLTLARLDSGVERLRPNTIDAGELAEQCASVVRPLAEARGLRLTVHRDSEATLSVDPDKMREVINNLLHNAIEYNRPQGTIDVSVERNNGLVAVRVSDTGIGMAPEVQPRIFERFYRADRSRGADGLHTGLGLAIVKEYIDLMGGTIQVDSAEGRGSTFTVRLPAGQVPEQRSATTDTPAEELV
jgi:heavy metal sensor kinase